MNIIDNQIMAEKIGKMYVEDKKSAYEIAEELGISSFKVYNALNNLGVKIRSKSEARIILKSSPEITERSEKIVKMYVEDKKSANQIARELGMTTENVIYYLEKLGIERRSKKEAVTLAKNPPEAIERAEKISKMYVEDGKSAIKIADELGMSTSTVIYILNSYGVGRRTRVERVKLAREANGTNERAEKISKMYVEEGKSVRKIADELGISAGSVQYDLRTLGVQMRPRHKISNSAGTRSGDLRANIERMYIDERKTMPEIAAALKITLNKVKDIVCKIGTIVSIDSKTMTAIRLQNEGR